MKGIHPLERHFEKIILALVALSLLAWVGADLVGFTADPIKMGGKEVALDEIGPALKSRSDKLSGDQTAPESPVHIDPVPAGVGVAAVKSRYDAPVAPDELLPAAAPSLATKLFKVEQGGREVWYHEPSFGAVMMDSPVTQSEGAVPAGLEKSDPKLAAALDARPGWVKGDRNVIWTTPAATVNLKAIREELNRVDAARKPAEQAIPPSWRNNGLYLVDVVFERQRLQADGSWGATEIVEPIPGQSTYRGQSIAAPAKVFEDMRADKSLQLKILQPAFLQLATTRPDGATEAGKVVANPGEPKEIVDKRLALAKRQQELAEAEEKLAKAGGEYYDKPADGTKKKGGKGGGSGGDDGTVRGGGGPGGGAGGAGRPPADGEADPNSPKAIRNRKNLTAKRDQIKSDIARLEKELGAVTAPKTAEAKPAQPGQAGLNVDDSIRVWAHDIRVQPGDTYRYRCSIAVLNPFLGRKRQLVEAQRPLDAKFQILSAPSEWVQVTVSTPYAFYAVEAYPPDGVGSLGSAQMEVFRLVNGAWRSAKFAIEPGDAIGRHVKAADGEGDAEFDGGWYVVAVLEDLAAESRDTRNKPTLVVVARRDGSGLEIRSPRSDAGSEQRRKLQDRVQASRDAKPGAAGGSGSAPAGS